MHDREEPLCRKTATTAAPFAVTEPVARMVPEVVQVAVQTARAGPGTPVEPTGSPDEETNDKVEGLRVDAEAKADSPATAAPGAGLPIAGHPARTSRIFPTRLRPVTSIRQFDATCSVSTRTMQPPLPATW